MSLRSKKYKDKERLRKTRNSQGTRYYGKTSNIYPRRKWTNSELNMIFERNITDPELSKAIQRSVHSIQQKRYEMKRLLEVQNHAD